MTVLIAGDGDTGWPAGTRVLRCTDAVPGVQQQESGSWPAGTRVLRCTNGQSTGYRERWGSAA